MERRSVTDGMSARLQMICRMVLPCETAADIGCDHGFTAIRLVQENKAGRAICSDVRKGPLQRAREHIDQAGLSEKIDCRLGNGLQTLKPGEADAIIIAGMGGKLMETILLEQREIALSASQLLLSPHTDAPLIRKTIEDLLFRIDDEQVVEEEGKFYTMIRAVKGQQKLSAQELRFGPVLLRKRPEAFLRMLRHDRDIQEGILSALSGNGSENASMKKQECEQRIREITEILEGRYDSCEH